MAAGLVPFAIGSETSGSILTPAAFCGVTGLRPTYGLVSRHGAMALSWTMDKLGPMCRSAEDCGLVLQAIAGGDADDPGSARKSFYYTPQYYRPAKDLRIGYAPVDFAEWARPSARACIRTGARRDSRNRRATGRDQAARSARTERSPAPSSWPKRASIFEPLISSGKVDELADPKQIAGLKAGLEISAQDYLKAMRIRTVGATENSPAVHRGRHSARPQPLWAPRPKPMSRSTIAPPESTAPKDLGLSALIPAGNLAGIPALSLPCGFADGLPVAIQLVGPPFSENVLLAMGKEFQTRTDWHRKRPKVK